MNRSKSETCPFDLLVFGAVGFIGRLVEQYLLSASSAIERHLTNLSCPLAGVEVPFAEALCADALAG